MSTDQHVTRLPPVRVAAGIILLVGVAFVQQPGSLIADTKFDLAVDPWGFLMRAAHLWDADAAFGQLQNQAYGYWWPMGPFFGVLSDLGASGWVVQRLWIALVLSVAFVGAALLIRALGVSSDLACLASAFAYALSPRIVSIVGGISIEAWPSALAPWVLLPLVTGSVSGSARRSAALSALAIGMVGGVNAAATAAVLPLGAVWLVTRQPGPRRRALMTWWPVFTFMATAWWLVPLLLLGAFSPPFLDWIESASITTFPTEPFDVLRGTSAWIPYVESGWPAGNDLLRQSHLVLNSGVLLVAGLVGILLRRNPHRVFLASALLVGMVLVSLGHVGSVEGWFAEGTRALLDGPLAPLRNVHKFDPVVRVPLVVGLAWALQGLVDLRVLDSPGRSGLLEGLAGHARRSTGVGVVLVAVAATASPAVLGRLAPAEATVAVPEYWSEVSSWLAHQPDRGTALLLPGSSFGSYVWGSPRDEPMQFLSESPWAVRNAVPLAPAGNVRMLDAVESRLAQGRGSPGLAPFLARAGVTHLVVRNDLRRSTDVPDPVLVHRALADSPGIERVAEFGPLIGGGPRTTAEDRRVLVSGGWQSTYAAVEVFEVPPDGPEVATDAPMTVAGGPEDLLDLADLGILDESPTILAADGDTSGPTPGPLILTDGLRSRERFFGRIHDSTSPVRTPDAPATTGNPTPDYLIDDSDRWMTSAAVRGNAVVTSSSSAADAGVPGGTRRGFHPYSAVDDDPDSSFRSSPDDSEAWWRVSLEAQSPLDEVQLTGGRGASTRQRVVVRADGATVGTVPLGPGERRRVSLSRGQVRRVEIASASRGVQLDLAEVDLPGVVAERWLATPELPPRWGAPDAIVLRADMDHRTGCVRVDNEVRCAPEQPPSPSEEPGPLRRLVDLPESRRYPVELLARADQRSTELLLSGRLGRVGATSRQYQDLRASAVAAADGDRSTTWLAAQIDTQPTLSFNWLRTRQVRGLRLFLDADSPGRRPERVRVSWAGGQRVAAVGAGGRVSFRPFRASSLRVEVIRSDDALSLGFDGNGTELPVGVTEARIFGVPEFPLRLDSLRRDFPCGSGPVVDLNGRVVSTRVRASDREIMEGRPVPVRLCGERAVTLTAGTNRLEVLPNGGFVPSALVLGGASLPSPEVSGTEVSASGDTRRTVAEVGPDELVSLEENANDGWRATQGGTRLRAVTVDGWRPGWWTRSEQPVEVEFAPDALYRAGMLGGALSALVLVLLVLRSARWRHGGDASAARRLSGWTAGAIGVLAAGMLAGWMVAVVAAVLAAGLRVAPRSGRLLLPLCAVLVASATMGYVWRPWGGSQVWAGSWGWPGQLVVLAVVGTLLGVASAPRPAPSRRAGRSTAR